MKALFLIIFAILLAILVASFYLEENSTVKQENKPKQAFIVMSPDQDAASLPNSEDDLIPLEVANKIVEEYSHKIDDADKKMNHAGKVFALKHWETTGADFKKTTSDSKELASLIPIEFRNNSELQFYSTSIQGEKKEFSYFAALSWNSSSKECILYGQLKIDEEGFAPQLDRYPLPVDSQYCENATK